MFTANLALVDFGNFLNGFAKSPQLTTIDRLEYGCL